MNASSCSYFIINIIGFYNLTLMYIFLNIKLLPRFARLFLVNLAYVFFARGSISEFISQISHKN
jgi:hypothetical protein